MIQPYEIDSVYVERYQERFWSQVDKTDVCWLWTAGGAGGYGTFMSVHTHVYSYVLHFGFPPDGHCVHHKCGNKRCVNPAHLTAMSGSYHMSLHARSRAIRKNRAAQERLRHRAKTNGVNK